MNKNPAVDTWFATYESPMKEAMLAVREIILKADKNMEEDIKWSAPNFKYNGNLCTFNPRAKKFVNLTFHTGAEIEDQYGILEGDGKKARVARFVNMEEVQAKQRALEAVVKAWVEMKG